MDPMTRDECPLCRSLFEEHSGDPWRDLLQPALMRVPSLVDERLEAFSEEQDPSLRARCQAIGARALYALGRPSGARAQLDQALLTGVPEAWALESVVGPEPEAAIARLVGSGSPGERADAACDGVLLALRAGETDAARGWVTRALVVCPDHAEAERWRAYLDAASDRAAPLLWSFDKPQEDLLELLRRGRADDPLFGHLADLLPRAWEGMFSRERMTRRHQNFARLRPAAVGTGLARLRETGRIGRWLAADHAYAGLAADHPQVQVELCLDRARACQAERRSAWGAVDACWRLAPALDPEIRSRLTQLLVLLALREPGLAGLADHASATVLDELPSCPDLLGARAAALVLDGHTSEAVPMAKRALRSHRGKDLGVVLALETLRKAGADRTVRRALQRAVTHPDYGWIADSWLTDLDHPPLDDDLWDLADRWDGDPCSGEN